MWAKVLDNNQDLIVSLVNNNDIAMCTNRVDLPCVIVVEIVTMYIHKVPKIRQYDLFSMYEVLKCEL